MTRSRQLARGFAWTYGLQFVAVVIQLGYASITSRLADAHSFGQYGIALSAGALVSLVASGGLAQTVGRLQTVDKLEVRGIAVLGLLLGLAGAAVLFVTAGMWATLWGVPDAARATRVMSVAALTAPLTGLLGGLMRRLGSFKRLAFITLGANMVGMAVGVVAVWTTPTAVSLLVSPVTASALTVVAAAIATRKLVIGRTTCAAVRAHLGFSTRLTGIRVMSYASSNIGRLAVSNVLGAAAVGQWNRADAIGTVPIQQAQTAMVAVIYPEFRHAHRDRSAASKTWSDLLVLLAWFSLPTTTLAAVAVPHAIPILFGSGWGGAQSLAPVLVMAAGVQTLTSALSSAIESLGRFNWLRRTVGLALGTQVIGASITVITHSWWPAITAVLVATCAQHAAGIYFTSRNGYLRATRIARTYAAVAFCSAVVGSLAWGTIELLELQQAEWRALAVVAAVGAATVAAAWCLRSRWEPFALLKDYGAFGGTKGGAA